MNSSQLPPAATEPPPPHAEYRLLCLVTIFGQIPLLGIIWLYEPDFFGPHLAATGFLSLWSSGAAAILLSLPSCSGVVAVSATVFATTFGLAVTLGAGSAIFVAAMALVATAIYRARPRSAAETR